MVGQRVETLDDLLKKPAPMPFLKHALTGYVIPFSWYIYGDSNNQHWLLHKDGPEPAQLKGAHLREARWKSDANKKQPRVEIPGMDELATIIKEMKPRAASNAKNAA